MLCMSHCLGPNLLSSLADRAGNDKRKDTSWSSSSSLSSFRISSASLIMSCMLRLGPCAGKKLGRLLPTGEATISKREMAPRLSESVGIELLSLSLEGQLRVLLLLFTLEFIAVVLVLAFFA
jgi:hypothetical protein